MFVSLIIVFREAMEAGLIVGIVLAATEGVPGRGRWIAGGIAAGVAG
ncbi:MAG TPA: iron permease, partial [Acetobacteraceae bacterium]